MLKYRSNFMYNVLDWFFEHVHKYRGVYSIQHYMIKFVSDLRHVGGFLRVVVLRCPPPIKLTAMI